MNPLLAKLSQFVGYGSKNAKVIFIGIEEKTNDDRDEISYKKRLEIQAKLEPFTDLQELCDQLDGLYNPQKSGLQPQPTWAPLCSIMLGIDGKFKQMGHSLAIIEYQRTKLGKIDGDNLLVELLPVPKSGASVFGDIHSRFLGIADLDKYQETVLPVRQKLLAEMLKERFAKDQNSRPRLIVAYGRHWRDFEKIFEVLGRMQYTDDFDGRIRWAKMNGCLFMLTYHPMARDKSEYKKFDTLVAKRIVEIYGEQVAGALSQKGPA